MLSPVAARGVITREIGAVVERLERASNDDWATKTRCTEVPRFLTQAR